MWTRRAAGAAECLTPRSTFVDNRVAARAASAVIATSIGNATSHKPRARTSIRNAAPHTNAVMTPHGSDSDDEYLCATRFARSANQTTHERARVVVLVCRPSSITSYQDTAADVSPTKNYKARANQITTGKPRLRTQLSRLVLRDVRDSDKGGRGSISAKLFRGRPPGCFLTHTSEIKNRVLAEFEIFGLLDV